MTFQTLSPNWKYYQRFFQFLFTLAPEMSDLMRLVVFLLRVVLLRSAACVFVSSSSHNIMWGWSEAVQWNLIEISEGFFLYPCRRLKCLLMESRRQLMLRGAAKEPKTWSSTSGTHSWLPKVTTNEKLHSIGPSDTPETEIKVLMFRWGFVGVCIMGCSWGEAVCVCNCTW